MKTCSYWRLWWAWAFIGRNSFNGLSSKSSPYGISVLKGNAFGASEVEVVTMVRLLSKRNIVVVQFEQHVALLTLSLASAVLVCLFTAAAPECSSGIWSLCSSNIDLHNTCRSLTESLPEVPTVIWINLSHCPSGLWWCTQDLCKELKRTVDRNCIWGSFSLGSH